MPTVKPPKDDASQPTPQPEDPATPAAEPDTEATSAAAEISGPEPGVYEFTHYADCVYPHVPLTCRAARPERPAIDNEPGEPEVKATVFDWPFGPPDDGRWTKTRKKPNQAPDNAGPLTSEE